MSRSPLLTPSDGATKPTFKSGKSVHTLFSTSNYYVIAIFKDKSKAMVASFPTDAKDPFPSILDYLVDDFTLGEPNAKQEGVDVFLITPNGALKDDATKATARGFLDMLSKIVGFNVTSSGIIDPGVNLDRQILELNKDGRPQPLVIGKFSHPMR